MLISAHTVDKSATTKILASSLIAAPEEILNFEKKVGKQRLINACKRALDFRIYSFKAIQNILENNLDNADNEQEEEFELPNHNNIRGKNYYK